MCTFARVLGVARDNFFFFWPAVIKKCPTTALRGNTAYYYIGHLLSALPTDQSALHLKTYININTQEIYEGESGQKKKKICLCQQ